LGDQFEDLLDFGFLVRLVVIVQRVMDTGLDMMLENVFLDFLESTHDRAKLDKDINTVTLILDHLLDTPHLSFYAIETRQLRLVCGYVFCQSSTSFEVQYEYTYRGYSMQQCDLRHTIKPIMEFHNTIEININIDINQHVSGKKHSLRK
jgi:hypothetical protein